MNWKIFIVIHGPIENDYYLNDPKFSYDNFTLFNVSDNLIKHDKFEIINKSEIKDYIQLGKWYAEAEAIYNIFKNNLYQDYDYIGFIHWDYELRSEDSLINYNVVSAIEEVISQDYSFISFSTFDFSYAYNQHIMMDTAYPNQCYGEGKNCFETIVEEYNDYFKKSVNVDYLITRKINLCSAFMCKKSVFQDLMGFYCCIIEEGNLNKFDTNHEYRFQGVMMERYIGCYSHQFNFADIPLFHHYQHKKEATEIELKKEKIMKLLSRIKRKIIRK
jgi:hypothetical protein